MGYDPLAVAKSQAKGDLRNRVTRKYASLRENEWRQLEAEFELEWAKRLHAELPKPYTLQDAAAEERATHKALIGE